jgi:hypothetical protein
MAKVTLKEIYAHLKLRSRDDLANDMLTLYTRYEVVRSYFEELLSDETEKQDAAAANPTPAKPATAKGKAAKPPVEKIADAPSSDVALRQSKAELRGEFSTSGSWPGEARLSVARKVVSDFKKVATSNAQIADVMLYYVECGVRFTTAFGDIDAPFYASMSNMYQRALEFMAKHDLREQFKERGKKIVEQTRDMGWGFGDAVIESYNAIYDRDE